MSNAAEKPVENHVFEADVARLLHLMVHSVYSDKDVFLRELISNAADACEKLRYEAISAPELLNDDPTPRITLTLDAESNRLVVEDNGIGMSRDDMVEALGTIARSGTRAFMERVEAGQGRRRCAADRPVWRWLLFRLHGGRQGRCRSRAMPAAPMPLSGRRTAREAIPCPRPISLTHRHAAPASRCT